MCSVPRGREGGGGEDIVSTIGMFSTTGDIMKNLGYWTSHTNVSKYPPEHETSLTLLMIYIKCIRISSMTASFPQCTQAIPPRHSRYRPQYSRYTSMVLKISHSNQDIPRRYAKYPHCTEYTLCGVATYASIKSSNEAISTWIHTNIQKCKILTSYFDPLN